MRFRRGEVKPIYERPWGQLVEAVISRRCGTFHRHIEISKDQKKAFVDYVLCIIPNGFENSTELWPGKDELDIIDDIEDRINKFEIEAGFV
jgi:hypothetical protein